MDGSCKRNLRRIPLTLFCIVAAILSSGLLAQESSRLGLLPAVFASPSAPSAALPNTFTAALRSVLQRKLHDALAIEPNLTLLSFDAQTPSLPATLEKFPADSVRLFCQKFQLEKLLLPSWELSSASDDGKQQHRVLLRWLDAASGEMTKFQIAEFESAADDTTLAGFEAQAAVRALLDAPELILSQDQQAVALLPALRELPQVSTPSRSRRWLWYVSAAALLGGGSAYLLLQETQSTNTKRLLPEPPGPPPQ